MVVYTHTSTLASSINNNQASRAGTRITDHLPTSDAHTISKNIARTTENATPVNTLFILGRLESSCNAWCVPHYFRYKKAQALIFVLESSSEFATGAVLSDVTYCINGNTGCNADTNPTPATTRNKHQRQHQQPHQHHQHRPLHTPHITICSQSPPSRFPPLYIQIIEVNVQAFCFCPNKVKKSKQL